MKASKKKPSLTTIAETCGVTAMTVSLALRGDSRISEGTRQKILEAASRLDYLPRASAGRPRQPSQQHRRTVEVVWGMSVAPVNLFHSQLLISIERELSLRKCDCVVRTCNDDYEQFLHLCETLKESSAVATLIMGNFQVEQLQSMLDFVPKALLVDNTGDPRLTGRYEFVAFDNVETARLATLHLSNLGHKRILLIAGPKGHSFTRDVEQGYREVLCGSDLPFDPELIRYSDFSSVGARSCLQQVIADGVQFDGIFTTEEMAAGVLRGLYEAGLKVPDDVSVVGCDGLASGRHMIPALTTVGLDYQKLGKVAVERILAEGTNPDIPCRMRLIPELTVRESTIQR